MTSWPSVRLIGMTMPVEDEDYAEPLNLPGPLGLIEFAGRWDYGPSSIAKMEGKPEEIIARWLKTGEESMVEMVDVIFLITCSRVVSHELVRHRLASYQQESQRFVKYDDEVADDLFYVPPEIRAADQEHYFKGAMALLLMGYRNLKQEGVKSQIARYILPNATRTRIVVKMNARTWRHVLALRLHTSAQPEMREVMGLVHGKLVRQLGSVLFPADIAAERAAR